MLGVGLQAMPGHRATVSLGIEVEIDLKCVCDAKVVMSLDVWSPVDRGFRVATLGNVGDDADAEGRGGVPCDRFGS